MPDRSLSVDLSFVADPYSLGERDVFIGVVRGQWPIQIWESIGHAQNWLDHPKAGEDRRVYSANLTVCEELVSVHPEPYLQPKPADG